MQFVRRILKWACWGLAGTLLACIVAGNAYSLYGQFKISREYPPPGKTVSIGTHDMHIYCVGQGEPTVMLDAGGGGYSLLGWSDVLEQGQSITRVCAYDRSGMGWSEMGPESPSPESRLRDLERLLAASAEPAPYILVAHSLSAVTAWQFAERHPDTTAGVIIVDGLFRDFGDLPGRQDTSRGSWILEVIHYMGLSSSFRGIFWPWDPEVIAMMPESVRRLAEHDHFLSSGYLLEQTSLEFFTEAARDMEEIGDTPLIVLSHGTPGALTDAFGPGAEEAWQRGQEATSQLSSHGRLVVVGSSDHFIPTRAPEAVVDAIGDLVADYSAGN